MYPSSWVMAAALILVSPAAHGAPRALTLAQALRLAERRAPALRAAVGDETLARVEAERLRVGPSLAPELQLLAGPCWSAGGATGCVQASVAFPLPRPGEGAARGRAAERQVIAASEARGAAGWTSRLVAAGAYLEGRFAAEGAMLAAEGVRLAEETLRRARARLALGAATELERVQAEAHLWRRRREEREAHGRALQAEAALGAATGLREAPRATEPLAAVVKALRAVAAARPEEAPPVLATRRRAEALRAEAALARTRGGPAFSVIASYQRDDALHQAYLGLSLPLSMLSRAPRAAAAVAEARATRADLDADLDADRWRRARERAQRGLAAREEIGAHLREEEARSEELLALHRRGFDAGQLDVFRVIAAEEGVVAARRALLEAAREEGLWALRAAGGGR